MKKIEYLLVFILILITSAVYYNSLNVPFVFDDKSKIVDNPDIKKLSNLKTRLIYPYSKQYHIPHRNDPSRPLTYLTFTLNYHFNQLNPPGYHVVNILLHACNTILFFFFIRKLFSLAFKKNSLFVPFFSSLIFGVHTINTSAVSYIFSRSDLLATFFYVLSLLLFLKSLRSRLEGVAISSVLCFVLSLASKQLVVTLPAIVFLVDYIFVSNFDLKELWKRKYYHLSFWLVLAVYIIFRYFYFGAIGDLEGMDALWDAYPYLLIQPYVILRYILFMLAPAGFSYYHYLNPPATLFTLKVIVPVLILAGAAFYVYRLWKQKNDSSKMILFSILWFFITLSPTSTIFPTTTAMVENRLYLPGIGFYILLVLLYFRIISVLKKSNWIFYGLIVTHILVLCTITVRRNTIYGNPVALWNEVVQRYPYNVRAYNNLGNLYCEQGEYQKAIKSYQEALRIKQDYAEAHNNLAIIYSIQKDYNKAIEEYEATLKIDPKLAEAYTNLGNIYSILGKYDKAIGSYKKALDIDPNLAGAYYNMGVVYTKQKEYLKALLAYLEVKKINPYYENVDKKIKELHEK